MAGYRSSEASKRVVDETKRLYSDLLSKPLDSRQLARPTFKYIQEIAKNLITETRTLRNVFNPSDFETENKTWDTRRKCDFVQRLIDFAANHEQPVVGCVAAKLVAGLDPNKTNELLQSLARIAQKRLGGAQERNSNRPRTFTRQSPNSVSPPKQHNEDGEDVPKEPQQAPATLRALNSKPTTIKTASQRNVISNKLAVVSKKSIASTRETSANDRKNSNVSSRRTSMPPPPPELRSRISSVTTTNDTQNENNIGDSPTRGSKITSIEESNRTQSKQQVSVSRLSQSTSKSKFQLPQDVIVSESDIGKNIQQLRSSLDHLRVNLLELSQFDVRLKTKLKVYIDCNTNKL